MGRRIEVELTSIKDDGTWTWRAAGAKQPKGDMVASLLYDGAKVGDVVKVEADFHLDGIEVTEVHAPKQRKERTDLLEMKARPLRDDELVTTQRVSRNERRGDRKGGGRGRDRDRDRGRGRGDGGRGRGERRGPRPEEDRRPRPKRLRAKRTHRDALLASVAEEHRPIVEQVIKDGMPGVRAAIDKQNADAKEAGKPEIDASPILAIAEKNLGQARLAEWRDRADAALADADELDIRDLRSVVVAGADVARDEETRGLVDQIKTVLDQRLESDHANWLNDLDAAVNEGRVVRGLRLSSRPVKAGAPLPPEMASKLAQQASEALAADVAQDRWATVLDALAFSPVRGAVTPAGIPTQPSDELLAEVRRLSDRIPTIAGLFGIDPAEVPKSAKRRRPPRKGQKGGRSEGQNRKPAKKPDRPVPGAEKPKTTPTDEPVDEAATEPEEAAEAPVETPATEPVEATEAPVETPADETPDTDEAAPAGEDGPAEQTPVDEAPSTDEDAPAGDEQTPVDEAPSTDEDAPAGDEPTPADEAPSTDEDAPAGDEPTPADETPATEEAAANDGPAAEVPTTDEAAPVAEEAVAAPEQEVAATEDPEPVTEEAPADSEGTLATSSD